MRQIRQFIKKAIISRNKLCDQKMELCLNRHERPTVPFAC